MVGEVVGIGGLLGEQHFHSVRVLEVGDALVEGIIGGLGVILPGHHLVAHVLGDGEHLRGGQTHIQVVSVDAVLHIRQSRGGGDVHFLIVGQHGGAGGHVLLAFLAEDGRQHFQHGFPLGLVLLHGVGHSQLAHGIGQQPVVVAGLAEIGKDDAGDPPLIRDVVRQSRRIAHHSGLSLKIWIHRSGKPQLLIPLLKADVFQELLVFFKHFGPDSIIQTYLAVRCLTFISHAPLGALQAHELRDGTALHGLQTGVVIVPVGLIALDAHRLESVYGSHELGIVGGQGDAVLVKQILVGHGAVHLGTHGQPPDGTAGLPVHLQIAGVEGARHLGATQIHEMLRQGRRVVQREPAAGNDIRQLLAPGEQILVVFHGVEALDEGEFNVGEFLLQPG